MADTPRIERLEVFVGGLTRPELKSRLRSRGVLLNVHAETLLKEAIFDKRDARVVVVTERTVAELGLSDGATLPQIFAVAQDRGLQLCPADTGPYLRMVLTEQAASSNSVLSSGKPPAEALTVAAAPPSEDDDYPKGFYLRVVDDQAWLRGYRCDDQHIWHPDDRFVFAAAPAVFT